MSFCCSSQKGAVVRTRKLDTNGPGVGGKHVAPLTTSYRYNYNTNQVNVLIHQQYNNNKLEIKCQSLSFALCLHLSESSRQACEFRNTERDQAF